MLNDIVGSCRVNPSINKTLKPEGEVESILPKDPVVPPKHTEATSSTRKPKPFDLGWCGMTWPALQNYFHGALYLKALPEGFGLAEMYSSTWNPHNPYIPTIMNASENYGPVKIKHCSNGKRMWVYTRKHKLTHNPVTNLIYYFYTQNFFWISFTARSMYIFSSSFLIIVSGHSTVPLC